MRQAETTCPRKRNKICFSINLGAMGDTGYGDGEWRNIRCNIVQNAEPSVADPSGLIPGWTSLTN